MIDDLQTELNAALLFEREPPNELYHYTTHDGVKGIVETGELWATDVRFLNDELEFQYAIQLIEQGFVDREWMSPFGDVPALEEIWQTALRVAARVRNYVVAFSELPDDLSQWRAYCRQGGYAIGIDAARLREHLLTLDAPVWLLPCEYDESRQMAKVRQALAAMADDYRSSAADLDGQDAEVRYGAMFAGHVVNLATVFKHPSFVGEREWRLVLRPEPDDVSSPTLAFRTGRRNLIPYRRVSYPPEAIGSVWVGPTPHRETARSAAAMLLKSRGLDQAEVRLSRSPYRDW